MMRNEKEKERADRLLEQPIHPKNVGGALGMHFGIYTRTLGVRYPCPPPMSITPYWGFSNE